jgi:hypothetical protein
MRKLCVTFIALFLFWVPVSHASVLFDGTDDKGDLGLTTFGAALNNDFTIAFWHKFIGQGSGTPAVMGSYNVGTHTGFSIEFDTNSAGFYANGDIRFYIRENGGVNATASPGSDVLLDNSWQHFAAIRSSNTIKLYLDNVEVASADFTAVDNCANFAFNLFLSCFNNRGTPASYWNGQIADLVFLTNDLTAQERANLALSGTKRMCLQTQPSSISTCLPFDDYADGTTAGDGATYNDISAAGNDCTVDDGANDSGATNKAGENLSYP